jgi:hypothetical protein
VSVDAGVTCTPAACCAVATQTLQVLNRWNCLRVAQKRLWPYSPGQA